MKSLLLAVFCFWSLVALRATPRQQAPVPALPADAPMIPSALPPDELLKLFPDGPGKDVMFQVCTKCHPPEKIATRHQIREDWEQTINAMIVRGAPVTDENFPVILEYLAITLPLVINVNTATVEELSSGLELKHADAAAIVAYREQNGKFKTLDDLRKIPNIEFKRIQLKKDAIRY